METNPNHIKRVAFVIIFLFGAGLHYKVSADWLDDLGNFSLADNDDDEANTVLVTKEALNGTQTKFANDNTSIVIVPPKNGSLKLQRLTANCTEGIDEIYTVHIGSKGNCSDCLYVVLRGDEETRETVWRNQYGSEVARDSSQLRMAIIDVYKDSGLSNKVQEITLRSVGREPMLHVMKSMCVAAFKDFPIETTKKEYRTRWRKSDPKKNQLFLQELGNPSTKSADL
jgi:hypothetical protein